MDDKVIDILLVEDRPEDAELTMLALKGHKLVNSIVWLKDGQEAIDFLLSENREDFDPQKRPRMVLLDLKMPKVDGIEVLMRIRADERTRTLPVVVLTTSSEDSDIQRAYNLGVNSYIVKPVLFENFVECAKQVGLFWLLINQPPLR